MEHAHLAHSGAGAAPLDPGLLESARSLIEGALYMPHGHCYLWQPELVGLHVVSDALIGAAYLFISIMLYALVRRIRLPFSAMIIAFGIFIGACGVTHLMEVWNVWHSAYWVSGTIKAITAIASVVTGVYLVPLKSKIADVASAARLSEERRVQLESQNRELEALYERVKQAEALKSRFFANVSHELRTPLALIVGPVERARADPDLSPPTREALEVVSRNAELLLREVNDLLDASRLEVGRLEANWSEADLAALVQTTCAHFESAASLRRVALQLDAPGPLLAQIDVEKVERILLNLLSNAFKYAPENGTVRVELRREADRAIVSVSDNGPGVPAALRESIFERFRQGDPNDPRRASGTGLGLAIALDFAVLQRGTLRVEDAPGGGARFTLTLPLRAPEGARVRPRATEAERAATTLAARVAVEQLQPHATAEVVSGGRGARVLLVEDNEDMRRFLAQSLADEFRVDTAADGAEGLQKARAARPDVVVTDLMMPRMSGRELVTALRGDESLADLPVILLTAIADEPLKLELLASGAQDYLTKPVRAEELRARVRNLASLQRTRDVLRRELAARSGRVDDLAQELALRKRQLEAALEATGAARVQAEQASNAKSNFLRLVSHELRTPLTSIQLQLESEARRAGATESATRLLRSFRRLTDLVETVLEFTRVESGRLIVEPVWFELPTVARDVVDELTPQAQQRLLRLELASAPPMPPAHSDPRLVRIVVSNLVMNALKYTQQGSVQVLLSHGPEGHRVSVRDTGPGIPPEHQQRIFEPFEQGESLSTKHTPGVGLGLALVRELVAALGAHIELDSQLGRGSTFSVLLPAR